MNKYHTLTSKLKFSNKEINITIFDYDKYAEKYTEQISDESIGLDIISKCLVVDKCWEPFQTEITTEIFKKYDGIFIDVGSHLGYYSILASVMNKEVISIDQSNIFINLFKQTINNNNLKNINTRNILINDNTKIEDVIGDLNFNKISLIKIDIEGYESQAIELFEQHIKNKIVSNIILEISPKFNNSYAELCMKLYNYGYNIYDIGLSHQRQLNTGNTQHLSNLDNLKVNINNINEYIQNIKYGQSNFLFILQ